MEIHYFYKREYSSGFYDLIIETWLKEKETSRQDVERLGFTRLEKLRVFLSKGDHFHCYDFKHEFGKDSYMGHFTHTHKKLEEGMNKWKLKPIGRRDCEKFRKIALALYRKRSLIDLSDLKGGQTCAIRQIIGDQHKTKKK